MPRYIEHRDSQGRVSIEVNDKKPWLLLFYVVFSAGLLGEVLFDDSLGIPRGWGIAAAILFGLGGFVHYFLSRKEMRVLINPVSQKVAIGSGSRLRLLPRDTVTAAVVIREERRSGGDTWTERRVELMLRGGGRVPVIEGWSESFDDADCQRMAARINAALRP
jgi:hypothetical protein